MKTRDIKQAIENRITSAGQAIENSVRKLEDAGRKIDRFDDIGHIAEQAGMSLTDIEDAIGQYLRLVKGPPGAGVTHEWLMFEGFRYIRPPQPPEDEIVDQLLHSCRLNAACMRRIDLLERQLKVAIDVISFELPADIEEFLEFLQTERARVGAEATGLLTKYRGRR